MAGVRPRRCGCPVLCVHFAIAPPTPSCALGGSASFVSSGSCGVIVSIALPLDLGYPAEQPLSCRIGSHMFDYFAQRIQRFFADRLNPIDGMVWVTFLSPDEVRGRAP